MATIRRIVHATDFSPASRPAFRRALDLARANRAELIVLHVMMTPILYTSDGYALPQTYDRLLADLQAEARKQLDRLVAGAKARGVRARGVLLEGVAHDRIVRAARSARADLLVIGTHGRTGLARLFLGSVASRVIATATCPVLSVRADSDLDAAGCCMRRAIMSSLPGGARMSRGGQDAPGRSAGQPQAVRFDRIPGSAARIRRGTVVARRLGGQIGQGLREKRCATGSRNQDRPRAARRTRP